MLEKNGGQYYATNPEVYTLINEQFKKLDNPLKDEILWKINEAAIEEGIQKGMKFDFSFATMSKNEYKLEAGCVNLLFDNDIQGIMKTLDKTYLPARSKELQVLISNGYIPDFDDDNRVIHWILQ